jgi:hypothetical protein
MTSVKIPFRPDFGCTLNSLDINAIKKDFRKKAF